MKTLGQKFKILRQKKGVNQKTMADLLEVSIPAYSKLETGITDPNFSRLNQIAEVHGLNIRQLLNVGEDEKTEQAEELEGLRAKVETLELSVIRLQSKLIDLYDREDQRLKAAK
ncbi:helix-turn-helix domain-containing protein [Pedobacter sp. MR2016-24]|uniref:helix-turn-helix domain-containing protein n=1 Tax=Pedobacter sp. MR2016-24 TaxID=2994466 RepID=UPI0022483681|nr:helix-turn-helix transcriptional regulator [Pedobacter sp. MR2016-24]MCX2485585.1 helix-turn-helix transcriptional regulator [Pedobacter sp. MR2016-24]